MRSYYFETFFICCVLIFGLQLNAQDDSVNFEAVVSKKNLGLNENLRVDFKMNKDGDNFSPPNFEGFKVVGGPNQSVSNMWVNGCLLYTSPSPRDMRRSRMPSSA